VSGRQKEEEEEEEEDLDTVSAFFPIQRGREE